MEKRKGNRRGRWRRGKGIGEEDGEEEKKGDNEPT